MEETITRVVIADSHEVFREGIANVICSACNAEVIGQAGDGYSTIKVCRMQIPDVLFMDIHLTNPSGLETFNKVRKQFPGIKIIMISSKATAVEAFSFLSKGAAGFMPKQASTSHFMNAMNCVSMGYACIPAECIQGFVDLRRNMSRTGNLYGLSPREFEVLEQCKSGAPAKEIAAKLQISVRTVETHRNSIYRKTSTHSVGELNELINNLKLTSNNSPKTV